jgi:TPR repeat protein
MGGRGICFGEDFRCAVKSVAQGERVGFYNLGHCYRDGSGCGEDLERAKENFLVAAELGHVHAMVCVGRLVDKDDPRRFVWFGRGAASKWIFLRLFRRNGGSDAQLQ